VTAWTPDPPWDPSGPILVVDDDAVIRRLFRTALEQEGFSVLEASDGYEALQRLGTEPISLVVLDVHMPGLAGQEVLQHIRASDATVTLPVILVTGEGAPDVRIQGLDAGASDYLSKPVNLAELIARVRSHLRSQKAWQSSIEHESELRAQISSRIAGVGSRRSLESMVDAIVHEMAEVPDLACLGVHAIAAGDRALVTLGEYRPGTRGNGVSVMPRGLSLFLLELTREALRPKLLDEASSIHVGPYLPPQTAAAAVAPLLWEGRRVGLIVLALAPRPGRSLVERRRTELSTADELGVLAGAVLGPGLAERRKNDEDRDAMSRVIDGKMVRIALQPIVDMRTERRVGVEALTRFHDGMPPLQRFGEAAAIGLGLALEEATLAEAIRAGPLLDGWLSLNVSAELMLAGWTLPRIVQQAPCPVVLELTEHAVVADYDLLRAAITELPAGIRIAIDDAGAGYSSLRHIARLRPALVKLDQSLVQDIDTDPVSASLVAGMVHFAERSGIELVAEGVERSEEAAMLASLGVGLAQGFLFGRPVVHAGGAALD
jgi:EAL domain-containing protein (putative c-di-GMP-specific phosphodiesterase class I)/CheY-like chemotaxis protein